MSETPMYLINPVILERFRDHPDEWREEWLRYTRRKNGLDHDPRVSDADVEICAALLWWVTYQAEN